MRPKICFPLTLVISSLFITATSFGSQLRAHYNVRDFGAIGDGTNKDTVAFQKALDTCAVSGGGDVVVPSGNYLIGSIQIGNRTILRLMTNSVLLGSSNTNDYPMMDVRWEGRWESGRRSLIYSANVDHTGIIGPGRIEGNPEVAKSQKPRGALVLEPINCNDVRWEGFTVTQGGNWATHPTFCNDVEIKNVKISGLRDGIDIDSCKDVRIEGCDIDCGDDCISLKSGRGLNGARIGRPTENVLISHCVMNGRRFACIGIGSETSGGIRNVHIEDCKMTSRPYGIYIKSKIGRSGVIENIFCNNIEILSGGFLHINLTTTGNKNTADDPVEGLAGYPTGRNFRFTNIRVNCTTLVDAFELSTNRPLEGLVLRNITGTCEKGIRLQNIHDAKLSGIKVTGYKGDFLSATNVTGSGLESFKK